LPVPPVCPRQIAPEGQYSLADAPPPAVAVPSAGAGAGAGAGAPSTAVVVAGRVTPAGTPTYASALLREMRLGNLVLSPALAEKNQAIVARVSRVPCAHRGTWAEHWADFGTAIPPALSQGWKIVWIPQNKWMEALEAKKQHDARHDVLLHYTLSQAPFEKRVIA
jgi:hypothetical protein